MRSKTRLTITLPPELLAEVDRLIDGQRIRNRSHAIELLLREGLKPAVDTAVLLAGGPSAGGQVPALLPVKGQPLIIRTVNHLIAHGICSFVILAGGNEPRIREVLGEGSYLGAQIQYVGEASPLGTAGALKAAERYLMSAPFLVFHADILTDINVTDLVKFHAAQERTATIAVKPRQSGPGYGKVLLEGTEITAFISDVQDHDISIVSTGVYVFEPELLSHIGEGGGTNLETDVFPKLAGQGELSAFPFQGIWYDVSDAKKYELAKTRWQQRGGIDHDNRK
ncbi:MAG TPA: sugar phosphate nucleotidyltransferase [Anaerolineae bacterium]|jgi:mannose-1-phosphate guanylyltransferase|nr:sugar phosphate nucleotidyltransferase [Anaerolineae bacterium]